MSICIGTHVLVRAFGMGVTGFVTGVKAAANDGGLQHGMWVWEITLEGRNPHTQKDIRIFRQASRITILR